MSDTPRTDAAWKWSKGGMLMGNHARRLERELNAANAHITTLQTQLDQRWGMMRELEVECGTKDVAEAVKYIKVLKARIGAFEAAKNSILQNSVQTPYEFQAIINKHFWELI